MRPFTFDNVFNTNMLLILAELIIRGGGMADFNKFSMQKPPRFLYLYSLRIRVGFFAKYK